MVTILAVEGMSCPNCARHVELRLKHVAGVLQVVVSLSEKTAAVSHAPDVAVADLLRAVEEEGYEATVAV